MTCPPIDPIKIIEKYYIKDSDIYSILLIHSEHVRDKALEIAESLPDLKFDIEFISEAAMLHDIGIFKCDAPRIHCYGKHNYIEHGYLGSEILKAEGYPQHALVCERHTGTGISLDMIKKNNLPLPKRDMLPISLEEKLICYADKFFSKTKLNEMHSVEKIRKSLSHFGESQLTTFNAWHDLFKG